MPSGHTLEINPGMQFGRLTIIQEVNKRNNKRYFLCKCKCGNEKVIRLDSLRNGSIVSCGCYNHELSKIVNTKHGMYKSRIYRIWNGMKGRCLNDHSDAFENYGGRGIKICDEWLDFNNFYEWAINHGYQDSLTIERKNVNGNYEPSNCTWITMTEQKRNTTITKKIKFDGKEMTLRQWADYIGIGASTLCNRLKNGWSIEKALTTPSKHKFQKVNQP